jgi:hypothetical protein
MTLIKLEQSVQIVSSKLKARKSIVMHARKTSVKTVLPEIEALKMNLYLNPVKSAISTICRPLLTRISLNNLSFTKKLSKHLYNNNRLFKFFSVHKDKKLKVEK